MVASVLAALPAAASASAMREPVQQTPTYPPGSPGSGTSPVPARLDPLLTTPGFSELPRSVEPGQEFTIGVETAPGAHCAGSIAFRAMDPVDLPDVPTNGQICSWRVTAPVTTSPGTAVVTVEVSKSGQSWRLAGVVYVNPVGEAR
jgi:hypothetical protein